MPGYWRLLPVLLAVVLGCSGCSQPAAEAPYDSDGARTALIAALDAWKKGEAKSLAKRNPPIRFVDDDLISGHKLSEYEIDEPDLPLKLHQDVPVILEMRDAQGKRVRREARYQVSTEPALSVLRSDH
jgi:hypothetical protein